jgi:hypothetical protein
MSVPFLAVFEGSTREIVTLAYRYNEAMYIKPDNDSVTVIFSINFKDAGDIVLSKVFLQVGKGGAINIVSNKNFLEGICRC